MNCSAVDAVVGQAFAPASDGAVAVVAAVLAVLAALLLFAGERLVRPLAVAVGGVGAALVTFVVTREWWECEVRLAVAGGVGVAVALLAACVVRTAPVVFGAAGAGAAAHLVYDALPLPDDLPAVLLGRSAYYYAALGGAAVVGGALACVRRAWVLRVASALLGGALLVAATTVVWRHAGTTDPPSAVSLVILGVATLCGVLVQRRRGARAVPMGVAVA